MKRLLPIFIFATGALSASAISLSDVKWHNEATDTTRLTALLDKARAIDSPTAQGRVAAIALEFVGTPYVAHTLEGTPERLTVNVDELDCTTYVETVLALAKTIGDHRRSWRDYLHSLESLRYRNGTMRDYGSRLHYISDWIIDNTHRGNITEVTNRSPRLDYTVKTLDFMSANRDSYPALKDSAQYERIIDVERGYRSHRYPVIKTTSLTAKDVNAMLHEGDVVALTTKVKGLDVSHLGFIVKGDDGQFHLLHASSRAGKVIIDPLPLYEYLRRSKSLTGIRVIRLKD